MFNKKPHLPLVQKKHSVTIKLIIRILYQHCSSREKEIFSLKAMTEEDWSSNRLEWVIRLPFTCHFGALR